MRKRTSVGVLHLFLIATLFARQADAQGDDSGKGNGIELSLELEHAATHKRISLVVGQTLDYKLRSSRHFVAGQITRLTDSTLSFESKGLSVVARLKDIAALKIRKSTRKKAIGDILMVGGLWILVGVTANPAEGTSTFLNYLAYPVGLAAVIAGYSIRRGQKIDLDDSWSWSVKEVKVIESIERGSFIRIVLKSGVIIEEMKVHKVDSAQIKGFEISQDAREQFVYTSRTIEVSDIETLVVKKR